MAPSVRTQKISRAENIKVPPHKPPGIFGWRHFEIFLLFLGMSFSYTLRVAMSVAIVAMRDSSSANPDFIDFDWDESDQSVIISSFFWGYVVSQIPAGQLAQHWGAHRVLGYSVFLSAVFCAVTPPAAYYGGLTGVCVCRVLMGFFQGSVLPTIQALLAKWAPPEERGRFATFVYAGGQFGTVIAMPISGVLAASSIGWPSIFYIWGAATAAWAIVWLFLGKESPAEHPYISFSEKEYIEISLGTTEVKEKLTMPWKHIMTSLPFWALIVVHCGQVWGYWTLLTEIPTYMSSVLGFNIKNNGMLSALPYLAMWLLSFPMSYLSDMFIKKGIVSTGASRKICNSIGEWIPALALIGLGYVDGENRILAVSILVIAVAFNCGTFCGYQVNHMDLSPNFAGTMMGITNATANIFAIVAPLAVGLIITDASNIEQWRTVFFIAAGFYFLCNLCFVMFGSATIQWWNEPQSKARNDTESGVKPESSKERENQKY